MTRKLERFFNYQLLIAVTLSIIFIATLIFGSANTTPPDQTETIGEVEPRFFFTPTSKPDERSGFSQDFNDLVGAQAWFETTQTTLPQPATTTEPQVEIKQPLIVQNEIVEQPQPTKDIETLICSYPWDCGTALRVAKCESQLNPNVTGNAGERGIMQIHPVHRSWLGAKWDALYDPATNIQVAYDLWSRSGWGAWSCY